MSTVGTPDPLYSSVLKVSRAKQHVHDLDSRITEFLGREPYALVFEADADPEKILIVSRVREQMPDEFALAIGDAVHNLRSALDHAACVVAGTDAGPYFPIANSATDFAFMVKKAKIGGGKSGAAAVDAIRAMQPYIAASGKDLVAVRDLDNADKHRLLIPVATTGVIPGVHITRADGGSHWFREWRYNEIVDGKQLEVLPAYKNIKVGDNLKHATFAILFGDGPCAREVVAEALERLCNVVTQTLDDLRPFA